MFILTVILYNNYIIIINNTDIHKRKKTILTRNYYGIEIGTPLNDHNVDICDYETVVNTIRFV